LTIHHSRCIMFIMETDIKSTNKLLKVIIALLLRNESVEDRSLRDQIMLLADLGLKPIDISEIIGRTNKYVSKELSHVRGLGKGGNRG